uniref:Uncharacterized protein n=1 Tax=Arion vulgaris TaxID=1028688 RepID=A0A0B6Y3A9_9EUPU
MWFFSVAEPAVSSQALESSIWESDPGKEPPPVILDILCSHLNLNFNNVQHIQLCKFTNVIVCQVYIINR